MIFWKEWRETRFGFLVCLFFLTGLYYSIPVTRSLDDEYWIGVFLAFFGMGYAVVMGSGAFASEAGDGTLSFLISRPVRKTRILAAKYFVRGLETTLVYLAPMSVLVYMDTSAMTFIARILNLFYPPIVTHPWLRAHWQPMEEWFWVPPHLAPQYILLSLLVVVFIFSGSFLFSVIIPKARLSVLGGVALTAVYFSAFGMGILQTVRRLEQVRFDIALLFCMIAAIFCLSVLIFHVKEY